MNAPELEVRIQMLLTAIASLEERVIALEATRAAMPDEWPASDDLTDVGDIPLPTIPRGKYQGKLHAVIVKQDFHYVVWNADKGYATGLGFTDAQIAEARKLAATTPEAPRTGFVKTGYPRMR